MAAITKRLIHLRPTLHSYARPNLYPHRHFSASPDDNDDAPKSLNELNGRLAKVKEAAEKELSNWSVMTVGILGSMGESTAENAGPPKDHLIEKYFHPDNMSSAEKMKLELAKVRDEFKMSESDCGSTRVQEVPAVVPAETPLGTEKECKEEEAKSLSWRIEKLSKGDSVSSAFRSWMGDGLPIHGGEIFHTINRLRRLKSNKRALEVMEWVIREKPYKPKELDYSYLLEFTMKFHGVAQGETLFSRIPSEYQNELLYNNLVLGCLERGLIRLSLAYMKKMRELKHPISYLAYNRLILLHSSPTRRKAIPKILTQMRADKVARHVSTCNILMKMEANEHNIEGLVRVFGDMKRMMVEPNEISYCTLAVSHAVARLYTACEAYVEVIKKTMTGDNWSTLDILVILHGYLADEKELEQTWSMIEELPSARGKSFLLAIEAFGKAGNIGRAEELWHEMVSKKGLKSTEQFNSMIGVYCRKGLITKATAMYKDMEKSGCKPNAITLRHLALGCARAGLLKEASRTLELGSEFEASVKIRRSTPWLETTLSIVEAFAENGDVETVEKLFEELKFANYTRYTFVYNSLIKVYVKAKVYEPNLLRRMILGGCRPDAETYSLMKLIEQFRP